MDGSVIVERQRIRTPHVPEPGPGLWSNCMRVKDHVFVSGLVAYEDGKVVKEDAAEQAEYIFSAIERYLQAAGGAISDVVTMTIFVTSMVHRPAVLQARRKFFEGDFPCSTLVEVSALIDPKSLVEINAIAIVGSSKHLSS